ncbi:MAG: DUF4129 domain-containing protein [Actinomycetota bacterium]|nr:DUF4129 domain-containing protein [Actinomycetota bacterium]
MLAAALLAVLAFGLLAGPVPALAQDSNLDEYAGRIGEARGLVVLAARDSSLDASEAKVLSEKVDALLPGTERVSMGSNTVVVDNSVLASLTKRLASRSDSTSRAEIVQDMEEHLAALVSSAGVKGDPVPVNSKALGDLLAERQAETRNPISEYFARLVERLGEWLTKWWGSTADTPGVSSTFRTVTIVVLVLLALGLIWMIFRIIVNLRRGTARRGTRPRLPSDIALIEAAQDLPEDALAHADALAQQGLWREAVRALFGGAARELVTAGYILEAHRRTNGELLLEIRPTAPMVYKPLAALCALFERAWYGHHDPGSTGFDEARILFSQVLERLTQAPGAPEASDGGESE